jgi:predicted metal-binding membrane protein
MPSADARVRLTSTATDQASGVPSHTRPLTFLEAALQSHRLPTGLILVLLPLAAWAWIVVMARDMYGAMTGSSVWMMTATWDFPHLLLLWAMWAVMMSGMMLPSAAPTIVLYGAMARGSVERHAAWRIYALAAGYLAAWTGFSLGATVIQRMLSALLLLTPMMELNSPLFGAALLLIAGLYQLTPLKHACLRTCQTPFQFLISRWRPGAGGAFRLGVRHGVYCVGCCWALMLLLFAGGVMNLTVIAALTAFVAFEKLIPFGANGSRLSGVLLIVSGIWILVR